jgi:hypothetical protein
LLLGSELYIFRKLEFVEPLVELLRNYVPT